MTKPWEEIINTAIIGTDKRQMNTSSLPAELKQDVEQIEMLTTDKALQFLHISAVLNNYRKGGYVPPALSAISIQECPQEEKKYCSFNNMTALQTVIDDENRSLLFYWLNQCLEKNLIVTPEYIPLLFEKAEKDPALRNLIVTCCGVRGKWMAQFNHLWSFSERKDSVQTLFDHGKPEERKDALKAWRTLSPEEARSALEKTWPQEQAATKADLLSVLEINLQPTDEPFIKECWKEKSQKVKDAALYLLKRLPGSFVIEEIWTFLKPLILYKKSSSMLGLLNKETIEINLSFDIPEHFKTYGISHIDATKLYSEKEFTLSQLMAVIPLSYWETYFSLNANEIVALFDKKEETKKFISSFATAADTFRNVAWAKILYAKHQKLCLSVVSEFDEEMQHQIVLSDLQNLKDIYQVLQDKKKEWKLNFTLALIEKTAQEPYTYTKTFYKNIIHHLPVKLSDKLDQITITDPMKHSYWMNLKEELKRMLAIKQQINQSF